MRYLITFIILCSPQIYAQEDDSLLLTIPSIVAAANNNNSSIPKPPGGFCAIPNAARAEDSSHPDQVIGNGSPHSCTSAAVVNAIAKGGVITFNCGSRPIEIVMTETAKIVNNTGPKIVIDGGNKVTLSGGGAIWVRGGRFKIVNSRFERNVCANTGPDVGGAAVRVFSQFQSQPVYVTSSIIGGTANKANICSNGGGLSSIGVSFSIFNSLISHNKAIGNGANPQRPNTPGGGSGGAIYNDGNNFHLRLCGTTLKNNTANEGGGAIFFVSNNRQGTLNIENSELTNNPSAGFETPGYPGIFYLGKGRPRVINSVIK